jgi:cytochrome c oxidase subunit 3
MSMNAEHTLSRDEQIALQNRKTGITVFQISWIMVFICLSLINLQIRSNFPSWPPEGVAALDRILPTIATIALIASGAAARRGVRGDLVNQWRIALGLGIVFTLIMLVQWITVDTGGLGAQYSTIFRVMVAYHALHAVVIGWIMWGVVKKAARGAYADGNPLKNWIIEAAARLWYFVIAAWVLFYIVLYLI